MTTKNYQNIEIKKLPNSEVEIIGEITLEKMTAAREEAIKHLTKDAEISGFRKGHAPRNILIREIGEMPIIEHAAEHVLSEEYQNIISEHNLLPIDSPQISITKIAPNNPLGFKFKITVMPEFELPDYRKIARGAMGEIKPEPTDVTTDEVENVIKELQKNYARAQKTPGNINTEGDKEPLPEITDDFVKIFGNFKDVSAFKASIKENLKKEKEFKVKDKRRLAISETIVNKTSVEVPTILIEHELARMIARFKDDIMGAGLKYEDYLQQIKKTEEDLRKEWRDGAQKKAKFQLILSAIARKEKIKPEDVDIKKESSHILEHHKDVEPERVESYIEMILTNEKVLSFLESQV